MFNYLRLSYNLLRLANSVLDRRKEKFKKELEGLDLSERVLEDTLDCLIGIKDHLVRKMCIHWLKKKSIVLPEDLPKVEKAKDLVKGNRDVDYLKFDSPVDIIDEYDKISPDAMKALYNKVDLGEGVVIYTVEESKEGQYAVRKLADDYFGKTFDNWCIIQRLRSKQPDAERDKMGMVESAFEHWRDEYSAYPKRVAFKNGKFFAFCGSSNSAVIWWDRKNDDYGYIPGYEHLGDDENFIKENDLVKGVVGLWLRDEVGIEELFDNGRLSKEEQWKLINCPDVNKRVELMEHADFFPEGFLDAMADDENEEIRLYVAEHTSDIYTLERLSGDEDDDVREAVAENYYTPAEILKKLFTKEYKYEIYEKIAGNSNTPADVLIELSKINDDGINGCIAENISAPASLLVALSNDENWRVRSDVAKNFKTPADVLIKLSNDEHSNVRRAVAINLNVPDGVLEELSSDESADVRSGVAWNPSSSEDVLIKLSRDNNYVVRSFVAENNNVGIDVLDELSRDEEEYVRRAAIENLRKRGFDV